MTKYNSVDDLELINFLKLDDDAAFTEIYERHSENLMDFASSKLDDLDEAGDIIHDVFVKLWVERKQLKINRNLKAYLFTMVRYRIIDKMRRNVTHEDYKSLVIALQRTTGSEIEQHLAAKEIKQTVDMALEKLSPRVREIYKLSREEELSISEIATQLQLSEQTVKNQLTAALRHLRQALPVFFIFL